MLDSSAFLFAHASRLVARYPRFTAYLVIGGSAAAIDLLVFVILFNWLDFRAVAANVLSVSIATVESFLLNAFFNFRTKDRVLLRFLSFAVVSSVGLVFGSAFIFLLHDIVGVNGNIAKVAAMPPVVMLQFLLNKYVSFRR